MVDFWNASGSFPASGTVWTSAGRHFVLRFLHMHGIAESPCKSTVVALMLHNLSIIFTCLPARQGKHELNITTAMHPSNLKSSPLMHLDVPTCLCKRLVSDKHCARGMVCLCQGKSQIRPTSMYRTRRWRKFPK